MNDDRVDYMSEVIVTRICHPATICSMTHSNLKKGSHSLRLNPLSGEGWDVEMRPFCSQFISSRNFYNV